MAGPARRRLLLAGGGLMIRVAIVTFGGEGLWPYATWVFTAIACVLAGVALLLIALPRVGRERSDDDHKVPSSTASLASEGSSDGGNPLGGRIPTVGDADPDLGGSGSATGSTKCQPTARASLRPAACAWTAVHGMRMSRPSSSTSF